MGKTNNIIEINGKRYDAHTGALLHDVSHKKATPTHAATATHKPVVTTPSQPTMNDVVRPRTVHHASPHAPKPAKTLMRHAVKKPSRSLKRDLKVISPADTTNLTPATKYASSGGHKLAKQGTRQPRRIAKSPLVQHFAAVEAVRPITTSVASSLPQQSHRPTGTHQAPKPSRPKTTADLLERALQHADSHEQPLPKVQRHSRRRRKLGMVAAGSLTLAVAGFVISQEVPRLLLNLAGAKAGIHVSVPTYQPAGYSLGQLHYSSGEVATDFKSNSNDSSYSIVQKSSFWDSQALRDNVVAQADPHYQTVETGGRTIYLYGKHQATWVNGGIWYQINSDGSLSDRQLIQLATSL